MVNLVVFTKFREIIKSVIEETGSTYAIEDVRNTRKSWTKPSFIPLINIRNKKIRL